MTRVNLIPPSELCDQQLLAEHREIIRIPRMMLNCKVNMSNIPAKFTLGTGHVRFFYNKMRFLHNRYMQVDYECRKRGHNITCDAAPFVEARIRFADRESFWQPTQEDIALSRERILLRQSQMKRKPTWSNR